MAACSDVNCASSACCCADCAVSDSRRRSSSASRSRQLRSANPASCAVRSAARTRSRPRANSTSASLRAWRAASRAAISSCIRDCRSAISRDDRARVACAPRPPAPPTSAVSCAIWLRRRAAASAACCKLHQLEFEVVHAPLLRADGQAFRMPRLLLYLQLCVDGVARLARRGRGRRRGDDQRRKFVEFALARQHAVQLAVGREERDALRRDEMPLRRDERLALRPARRGRRAPTRRSCRQRTPCSPSASSRPASGCFEA